MGSIDMLHMYIHWWYDILYYPHLPFPVGDFLVCFGLLLGGIVMPIYIACLCMRLMFCAAATWIRARRQSQGS